MGGTRHPLETNQRRLPIGDVRSGSVKRLAAASAKCQVVAALHAYLAQKSGRSAAPALAGRI